MNAGRLLAASVMLAALVVQCIPGLAELLQWQRGAGAAGTWLTSHLCHWSWDHLVWDLATFGFLSCLALRLAPARYAVCLLVAAVLIPLEIQFAHPGFDTYRGLSGLDCALMGLAVATLWRNPSVTRSPVASKTIAALTLGAFVAKTMYEMVTGGTVFVDARPGSFVPAPSAHLVGFVCGLATGFHRAARVDRARIVCSGEPRTRPAFARCPIPP